MLGIPTQGLVVRSTRFQDKQFEVCLAETSALLR
jgi:hypothetical protein